MSQLFTNNAATVLASAKAAGATTMVVQAGTGARFPTLAAGDFFELTLFKIVDGLEAAYEIVKVTARSIDTFTIVGAQQGTTPTAFGVGDQVSLRVTAGWMNKATTDIESKAPTASPVFTGVPAVPGPPNFIKGSTQIAPTDYALAMGLRYGLGTSITASRTMSVAEAGTWFQIEPAGVTLTLPAMTAMNAFHSAGATFTFAAANDFTLSAGAGATVRAMDQTGSASMVVLKGECVTVQYNASAVWYVLIHSTSRATNALYFAPINSPTFTGTPATTAPAQFDKTTRIATTKFAMDMGLRFSGPGIGVGPGASVTVNAAAAGAWYQIFDATSILNIPVISEAWIGTAIGVSAVTGGTLTFPNGCVMSGANAPVTTYSMGAGETAIFTYNGNGGWYQTSAGLARGSIPAIVKSNLTGYKNLNGLVGSRAVTAADVGSLIHAHQADYVVSLPSPTSIGAKIGDSITFMALKGGASQASITLTPTGGATIYSQTPLPSLVVMSGQQVELVSDGGTAWQVGMTTARMNDNAEIAAKAPLASPAFTGVPTVPTSALQANGTDIANTAWVNRRGVGFQQQGGVGLNGGTAALTAANLGNWLQFTQAGCTLTIDATLGSAAYSGATFTVRAPFAGTLSFSGAGVVGPDGVAIGYSYSLRAGETVTLANSGGFGWYVVANGMGTSTVFATFAPKNSPVFTGTVTGIDKTMVGLANVDNTSDANKPVSTAQQTALDLKAPSANPTFTGNVSGVTKAMVGLANVDNTSDANKPVSIAQATAIKYPTTTDYVQVAAPVGPATLADGGAGALTGTYAYAITIVTANGETECGAESAAITVSGKKIQLSNIPVASDPAATARRIYRTKNGSTDAVLKYFVVELSPTGATTYLDNIADASLGAPVPRTNTTGGVIKQNGGKIATAGTSSTVFGYQALIANTGYACSAFGAYALGKNTIGYRNTGMGIYALGENTTGYENTAAGVHALNSTTTGSANSGFGYGAGFALVAGTGNTFVGDFAGFQTLGNSNTLLGAYSMFQNSGDRNTAVGHRAGENTTTGSGNVLLGASAGSRSNLNNMLFIDNQDRGSATVDGLLALVVGKFGSSVATQCLKVNGSIRSANASADPAVHPSATQVGTEINGSGVIVASTGASSAPFNMMEMWNGTGLAGVLQVSGGTVTLVSLSDENYKEQIAPSENSGDIIDGLEVVSFTFKKSQQKVRFGFIAQPTHQVFPESVVPGEGTTPWMMNQLSMVPLLIKEVQSLRARVKALENVNP